ncbi:MAG: tetratricopeptide repeat protein [Solirubrobacterales bacterium]
MPLKPSRKAVDSRLEAVGTPPASSLQPTASRRRVWLFRLAAILLGPLLFLGLLELGLRAIGYGYNPHVAIPCEVDGKPCLGENAKFGWRFFPPILAREFEPFVFAAKKPAGTCRIFVLGSSAAQGAPNNAFRFGRVLEAMLQERFPDLRIEVITTAMAAINSHVILEIARDCARYDPDFFVVYLGNNEVLGPYGPGAVLTSRLSSRHLIRLGIRLRATKVGQLISSLAGGRGLAKGGPQVWLGMQMFLDQQIRADDPRLKTTYRLLQRNLEGICDLATGVGAQTCLCTVGVNLRDCPPFASLHRRDLTAEQGRAWDELYKQGMIAETQGKDAEALDAYRKAGEIDGSYAELEFRLGRCYERSGEFTNALACYEKARDLDTLRFRASTQINEVISTVARDRQSQGVALVDAAAAMIADSINHLPGEDLFYEHVHMTFRGNYVLARAVFDRLEAGVTRKFPTKAQTRGEAPSLDWCADRLGFNDWSRQETLDMVIHGFLAKPPFTNQLGHKEQMERLNRELEQSKAALTPEVLQTLAGKYAATIAQFPSDWRLRWDYGQMLAEDLKQYDASLEQYRIVQRMLPCSYMPHDSLASVLRTQGDLAGAIAEYQKLLAIKPTSGSAYYYLGWCQNRLGRTDLAADLFRKAIRCEPDRVPAYLDLAELLYKSKKLPEAEKVCREGLAVAPNNARLHGNLGLLLVQTSRRQEGAAEVRKALELDPASPEIRRLAEAILGPAAIR